jgi:S1-C subfamily serine protease
MMLVPILVGLAFAASPADPASTAPRAQGDAEEVGRIASFDGEAEDYRLLRGGATPEPAAFLLPLRAGDTVTVLPGKPPLRLVVRGDAREDEDVIVCDRPGPRCSAAPTYAVRAPHALAPASGPRAWLVAVGDWLTPSPRRTTRLEVYRGSPEVPLLRDDRRFVEGTRPFELAWVGGALPCSISLLRLDPSGATSVAGAVASERREARTAPVVLKAGAYRVELSCADGARWTEVLAAVPATTVPALPDLRGAALGPELERTAEAAWLAASGWAFEAWLRLGELPDRPRAAESLREALAAGRHPPAPRVERTSAAAIRAEFAAPRPAGSGRPPLAQESGAFGGKAAPLPTTRGDVRNLYRKVAPATVIVRVGKGYGTGVLVSPDGLVLTNHHVVAEGERDGLRVKVDVERGTLGPDGTMVRTGESMPAHVLRWDARLDLAVLRIDGTPKGLPFVPLASAAATPGEPVAVIGHGAIGLLWSIRDCVVTAAGRLGDSFGMLASAEPDPAERRLLNRKQPARLLQTSCTITPGDSGGPVVNAAGKLVGVNDFIRTEAKPPVSTFFHVDSNEARPLLANLPASPPPMVPDPWEGADRVQLASADGSGRTDTIVLRGKESTALFVDVAGTASLPAEGVDVDRLLETRGFAAGAVLLARAGTAYAWYDTGATGTRDLLLVGDPRTGRVVDAYRLAPDSTATALPTAEWPQTLATPRLMVEAVGASRLATAVKEVLPGLIPVERLGLVPDPFGGSRAQAWSGKEDGLAGVLAWSTPGTTALLVAPAGEVPARATTPETLDAMRHVARFGFLQRRSGERWAYYDTDGDGTIDLALELSEGGVARSAWSLRGSEPEKVAGYRGLLALRPGLLKLQASGAKRVAAVLSLAEMSTVAARSERGLGAAPALLGDRWEVGQVNGLRLASGVGVALASPDAQAIVFSSAAKPMAVEALTAAVRKGKLPVTFGLLVEDGLFWAFYDRDGDGTPDAVLFASSASSGVEEAYVLSKSGGLVSAPELVGGPLFRPSLLRSEKNAAEARAFLAAIGGEKGPTDP